MNVIWDSLPYSWHLTIKLMASIIFSLNLCMSESFTSPLSHPITSVKERMERRDREVGTIQVPASPRGWLGIEHRFINDRISYSEIKTEYNFFCIQTHIHTQ